MTCRIRIWCLNNEKVTTVTAARETWLAANGSGGGAAEPTPPDWEFVMQEVNATLMAALGGGDGAGGAAGGKGGKGEAERAELDGRIAALEVTAATVTVLTHVVSFNFDARSGRRSRSCRRSSQKLQTPCYGMNGCAISRRNERGQIASGRAAP